MTPVQATLAATATSWSDVGLRASSPYTYVVTAVYPDGRQASTQVLFTTPPAINPSGFTAAQNAQAGPGQVQLDWKPVPGVSYYVLLGPGVPGGGTKIVGATSFTATGVPPGQQSWSVASYYDSGVPGGVVSTPAAQFSNASLNVTAPVVSGRYLVTVTGMHSIQMSVDDMLSRDGKGDEVFAAAYVRRYDRSTGTIAEATSRQTMVYGDVFGSPTRVQAGTMSSLGGIRDGDPIPDDRIGAARNSPAQDVVFPWRLWEGTLTDGNDALVISPSIWEVDGNSSYYSNWVQQQATRNASLFATQAVQVQIAQRGFGYLLQGGASGPQGSFILSVASLITGSTLDRPIGMTGTAVFPNTIVVLTREIIELALAQPAPRSVTVIPGYGQGVEKPGIILIPFVDGVFSDSFGITNRPAIYYMMLQVERVP